MISIVNDLSLLHYAVFMCKYFEMMQLSDVAVETVKYLLLCVQCVYVL